MAVEDSFLFGGVLYPLGEQPPAVSLLSACDPALAKLIDFLRFEIDAKIGLALTSAVARGNPPISTNILKVFTVDPFTHAEKADQLAFPFFAMWRNRSKMSRRTLSSTQDLATLSWRYTLPAMTLEQSDKFAHVLHAVVDIVNQMLTSGHDPAYNNDELVIADNGMTEVKLTEVVYEPYRIGDTGNVFNSVLGQIEMIAQRRPYTANLPLLEGPDVVVSQQKDDAETPVDVVTADASKG